MSELNIIPTKDATPKAGQPVLVWGASEYPIMAFWSNSTCNDYWTCYVSGQSIGNPSHWAYVSEEVSECIKDPMNCEDNEGYGCDCSKLTGDNNE